MKSFSESKESDDGLGVFNSNQILLMVVIFLAIIILNLFIVMAIIICRYIMENIKKSIKSSLIPVVNILSDGPNIEI